MKSNFVTILGAGISISLSALAYSEPQTTYIAVAEKVSSAQAISILSETINMAVNAPEGDRFVILSSKGEPLGEVISPKVKNPVARQYNIEPQLEGLALELHDSIVPDEQAYAWIDPVAISDYIALSQHGEVAKLLLLGNPVFYSDDPNYSCFDESKDTDKERYLRPAHSFIYAHPSLSIFSIKGKENSLNGLDVYWYNIAPDRSGHVQHLFELKNFWAIWFRELGARLMYFSDQSGKVIGAMANPNLRPIHGETHPDESELEIVSTLPLDEREEPKVSIPSDGVGRDPVALPVSTPVIPVTLQPQGSSEGSVATPEVIEEIKKNTGSKTASVSIIWKCEENGKADLDVWMLPPERNSKVIYYSNKKNSYSELLEDVRKADSWEQITLMRIPDGLEFWVNVYSASKIKASIKGECMIVVNGQTFIKPFEFAVKKGNGADDFDKRHKSKYWLKLDVENDLYR